MLQQQRTVYDGQNADDHACQQYDDAKRDRSGACVAHGFIYFLHNGSNRVDKVRIFLRKMAPYSCFFPNTTGRSVLRTPASLQNIRIPRIFLRKMAPYSCFAVIELRIPLASKLAAGF